MSGCLTVLAILFVLGLIVNYPFVFVVLALIVVAYYIYKDRYF